MDFGLSEEQTLLQSSVNRFLANKVSLDKVRQFTKKGDANNEIWSGLCDMGLGGILIPEELDGVGLSGMDACIVAECLGFHTTPCSYLSTSVMAPLALLAAQKREDLLAAIATGQHQFGVAFSDAIGNRAGSSLKWDGKLLNGSTLFVLDCDADTYLVATREKHLLIVPSNAKGLEKKSIPNIDKTRPLGALSFDHTPADLLSEDPAVFHEVLDAGRIMLAADTLGAAQNMLDQAVLYAGQREQFNRVIASFQAVKHMCAEMLASLEPSRAMVWYAGHTISDAKSEVRLTACHTKAHLSEVGQFVAKTSTEVHGGMGFTDLVGLHYWFKRIGYNRQMLGGPELLREEAAMIQGFVKNARI